MSFNEKINGMGGKGRWRSEAGIGGAGEASLGSGGRGEVLIGRGEWRNGGIMARAWWKREADNRERGMEGRGNHESGSVEDGRLQW